MAKPFLFVQKTGIGKVEVAEKEKEHSGEKLALSCNRFCPSNQRCHRIRQNDTQQKDTQQKDTQQKDSQQKGTQQKDTQQKGTQQKDTQHKDTQQNDIA